MNIVIIEKKNEWDEIFNQIKDKSVLASYKYLKAGEQLEDNSKAYLAILFIDNYFVVHPFIKRKINKNAEYSDLVSVYDFGGFWFNTDDHSIKKKLLKEFDTYFSDYCFKNNIVSEFIRLYPFFDYSLLKNTSYQTDYFTDNIVINLSNKTYEEIYKKFSPKRKNKIRQSIKNKLTIRKDNDISKFIKIYYKNLDRLSASQFYYFSDTFFQKINNFFDIYYVYDLNNDLCAGHIYLNDYDIKFVYLTAGVQEKLFLRPNCFAYNDAIKISKEDNYNYFHFGGGVESLYDYKKTFSKETIKYFICKKIFNHEIYNKLVNETLENYSDNYFDSFFPLYRKFDLPFKPDELKE